MSVKDKSNLRRVFSFFARLVGLDVREPKQYEPGRKIAMSGKPSLPEQRFEHEPTTKERIAEMSSDKTRRFPDIPPGLE
jgi:hypothetical protein